MCVCVWFLDPLGQAVPKAVVIRRVLVQPIAEKTSQDRLCEGHRYWNPAQSLHFVLFLLRFR